MSITYFVDARIEDAATLDRLVRFVLGRGLSLVTGADLDDCESGDLHNLRDENDVFRLVDRLIRDGEPIVLHEFAEAIHHMNEHAIAKVTEFLQAEGFGYRVVRFDDREIEYQRRWAPGMPYEVSGQMSEDDKLLVEMDTIDEMIGQGRDAFDAFKACHVASRNQTFGLVLGDEAQAHVRARFEGRQQNPRP
jgi:hypothetical protein